MRIGIITHPLGKNYGGILQNFALQQVLIRMGHQPITCDYDGIKFPQRIKNKIKRIVGYNKNAICGNQKYESIRMFVDCYIKCSKKSHTISGNFVENYNLDALIVGSDQVWRPKYVYNICHMFLSEFTKYNIKRVAYAASFGTSEWEYTKEQERKCKTLAKYFNAISVREDSAVGLCSKYLNTDACKVLDPTLLLEKEVYIECLRKEDDVDCDGELFCYILDSNSFNDSAVNFISRNLNYKVFRIEPRKSEKCETVTKWLKAFYQAKYVICDSFHGVVFSIIFQKPFIALANKSRGLSRFTSILGMFGLESRLAFSMDDVKSVMNEEIDWDVINAIRKKELKKSLSFIDNALK